MPLVLVYLLSGGLNALALGRGEAPGAEEEGPEEET